MTAPECVFSSTHFNFRGNGVGASGCRKAFLTFDVGHLDGLVVTKGSLSLPGLVHLVLQAAVHHTKLQLEKQMLVTKEATMHFPALHCGLVRPTSFLTAKAMDTATNGNLLAKQELDCENLLQSPALLFRSVSQGHTKLRRICFQSKNLKVTTSFSWHKTRHRCSFAEPK